MTRTLRHDARGFPDYAKLDWAGREHRERFARYVKAMPRKLLCQECGGAGYHEDTDGYGLVEQRYMCGWCEGTGHLTPWLRGAWLRSRKRTP